MIRLDKSRFFIIRRISRLCPVSVELTDTYNGHGLTMFFMTIVRIMCD